MPTDELCRMLVLASTARRPFPSCSAGKHWLTLGIVLMLGGRSRIPEAGRLVEIARLLRVRMASALRV